MAFTHKPGSFTLFVNDRKTQDNHPDRTGEGVDLDGNPIWVSGWLKKNANGTMLSCSFKLKTENPQRQSKPPMDNDPIPF